MNPSPVQTEATGRLMFSPSVLRTIADKADRALRKAAPRLWLDLSIARHDHRFDPEFWLLPRLAAGAVGVDVGANEGWYSYYMAKGARHVHAFEPNPLCHKGFRRIAKPNTTLHPCGLSDRQGSAELRFDPRKTGFGSIDPANRLDVAGLNATERRTIDIRTLDSFGLDEVTLIKIDVEGHEPAVVRGALSTIRNCRPVLLIESELRHNPSAFTELCGMLRPLGYGAAYLDNGQAAPVTPADLPALQQSGGRYVNNFLFLPSGRSLF